MARKDGPRGTIPQIPVDKASPVTLAIRGAWQRLILVVPPAT